MQLEPLDVQLEEADPAVHQIEVLRDEVGDRVRLDLPVPAADEGCDRALGNLGGRWKAVEGQGKAVKRQWKVKERQ